ncbi:MAG: CRISPR-associated protein Cas4 [Roseburia sp.]|nr:CRISPR-associated protein Cas4 [Roseburia sp.]
MLSGIQHFAFCRRQWALIHIEQQWAENYQTVDGELMHKKAHDGFSYEKRKDTVITRGMPIYSRTMGVSGVCDIVELKRDDAGVPIRQFDGKFRIMPVEYKRGKPKENDADILQLAAQVLCLEEMMNCHIVKGALYYGQTKRRMEVEITDEYREKVSAAFAEMHQYYEKGFTPRVKKTKACQACSLKEICLPELDKSGSAGSYIDRYIREKD